MPTHIGLVPINFIWTQMSCYMTKVYLLSYLITSPLEFHHPVCPKILILVSDIYSCLRETWYYLVSVVILSYLLRNVLPLLRLLYTIVFWFYFSVVVAFSYHLCLVWFVTSIFCWFYGYKFWSFSFLESPLLTLIRSDVSTIILIWLFQL